MNHRNRDPSAADRAWFQANPHRKHRIRRPLDENEGFGARWIVIRKVAPGLRMRFAIDLRPGVRPVDGEKIAREIYEEAAARGEAQAIVQQVELAFGEAEGRA
jgi:hypothetical protein